MRLGMYFRIDFGVKDHLGYSPAIAQINKDYPAVVAPAQDPAHQCYLLPYIFFAEIIT
jgi:hypothetical protein